MRSLPDTPNVHATYAVQTRRRTAHVVSELQAMLRYGTGDGEQAVVRDITELKQAEEEREILLHDMKERVKEITCMYEVASSIRRRNTLEEIFLDVATLIPPGWHYPEITRGRVAFEGREYVVEPFEETE